MIDFLYIISSNVQTMPKRLNERNYDVLIKKAIQYNENLHDCSIPETERCTVISSILIALQDGVFIKSFGNHETNLDLAKSILIACECVLKKTDLSSESKAVIIREYEKIRHNSTLIGDSVKKKKSKTYEANTILKDLIRDLKDSVMPFIRENDFDILGRFYREFIRYAGTDKKTGLVLTPNHVTDFFCEVSDLQYDDIVFDPCCGTGGFLVSAMKWMLNDCGNNQNEWEKIRKDRIIGIEKRADMFTHACSNMMMRGAGKVQIYYGDCFDKKIKANVTGNFPNKAFLNPPYDVGEDGQLEFVENTLNCISKSGICVAICQASTVTSSKKATVAIRERLLEDHCLKAVFSMPDDLFNPAAGVVTVILVFQAHTPSKKGEKTFFGYFKDDGHTKVKHKGRQPIQSSNKKSLWDIKKTEMLTLYRNKENKTGLSITQYVTGKDEWCAEAYMETDYSQLTENDFIKTIKNYAAFQFLSGDTK